MNVIDLRKRIPSEKSKRIALILLQDTFYPIYLFLFSGSNINSNYSFLLYVLCPGKKGTVKKR